MSAPSRITERHNSTVISDYESAPKSAIPVKEISQKGMRTYDQLSIRKKPTARCCPCESLSSCLFETWSFIRWTISRVGDLKPYEFDYFIRHPSLIVKLVHRERVKQAMMKVKPIKKKVKLSQVIPAHTLKGNRPAENKNNERVLALKKEKHQFDTLLSNREVITEEFIEKIMKSSSPVQLVYDVRISQYIAFSGNCRLIALKRFFSEAYPDQDPEIEMNVYQVNSNLIQQAVQRSSAF